MHLLWCAAVPEHFRGQINGQSPPPSRLDINLAMLRSDPKAAWQGDESCVLMPVYLRADRSTPPLSPALRDPAQHRHPRVAAGGLEVNRVESFAPVSCWCLRGLTPSIRLGRLDFCPRQSSIFRQSPTFMLKIRKRLDAHEPHELPCYGLTQKLHGRVTNPAYLCTRSTYAQTAARHPSGTIVIRGSVTNKHWRHCVRSLLLHLAP
eukprot:COSAG06_NODE_115_length_23358_cov_31.775227_17_plen_206_part_00